MNMSPGMTPYYGGFGPRLVAVIWALFGVATIVIVLRLITHFAFVKKGAGWSLVWALLAYVSMASKFPAPGHEISN